MTLYTLVSEGDAPTPMQHPAITLVDASGSLLSVGSTVATTVNKSDDLTNGTDTSFTTFLTTSYTPVGTSLVITGQGFFSPSGGAGTVELQIGATSYPIVSVAYGMAFARTVKVASTAGVAVTINLRYKMSAGGFYCRAATAATSEFAAINILDIK